MLQFVENEQLYLALNFPDKNVKYTYYNNYSHIHSIIDHFILSQCLFDLIISYHKICQDVDNMSGHSPLCLFMNIDKILVCVLNLVVLLMCEFQFFLVICTKCVHNKNNNDIVI